MENNTTILHTKLYDDLAEEYEKRVSNLLPITEEVMDYFSSFISPGGLILDIGCGVGSALNILNKKGFKTTGLEISSKMIQFAKKRNPESNFIEGDFLKIKFYNKFDAVLAFAFIHLFPKSEIPTVFAKIKSILKPNGIILLSSTESFESKEGIYIKKDFGKKYKRFRKFWTEQELRETFTEFGFKELAFKKSTDNFGKVWMDFIVTNK